MPIIKDHQITADPDNDNRFKMDFSVEGRTERFNAVIIKSGAEPYVAVINTELDNVLDDPTDENIVFKLELQREIKEIAFLETKGSLNDEEREFAKTILAIRGQIGFQPGGFRLKLVDAALSADKGNRERIYKGFPDLRWPLEALDTEVGNVLIFDILGMS